MKTVLLIGSENLDIDVPLEKTRNRAMSNRLINEIIVILGDKGYHAIDLFWKLLDKGNF